MSGLMDDPDFAYFIDWCIETTGVPPNTGDIMMWLEARATVRMEAE